MERSLLEKIDSHTLLLKSCVMSSYFESTISDCSVASILCTLWAEHTYLRTGKILILETANYQMHLSLITSFQVFWLISLGSDIYDNGAVNWDTKEDKNSD